MTKAFKVGTPTPGMTVRSTGNPVDKYETIKAELDSLGLTPDQYDKALARRVAQLWEQSKKNREDKPDDDYCSACVL